MKRLVVWTMAAAVISAGVLTRAQEKTIQGATVTKTVTVEAIDRATRQIAVKKADGTHDVFTVPEEMKRFDTLKVGDTITARYTENLVLRLQKPGEAPKDSATGAVARTTDRNAGALGVQRTITATITAIDMKVPSITLNGPNDWVYSTRVQDVEALKKVKVGDKLDITLNAAVILSINDAK